MNVTLRQLKAFLAGTTSTSFSEAAEKSHLTQPGYSLLIRQLEAELGVKLFDRTTRRVEITQSGAELKRRVAPLLQELDAILQDARNSVARKRGRVAIGFTPSISSLVMSKVIARLATLAPEVTVVTKEEMCSQLIEMIADGVVDLAVGVDLPASKAVSFQPLAEDPMVGIFHPGEPIVARPVLHWSELTGMPFITFGMSSVEFCVERAFAGVDARVQPIFDVKFVSTAINLVRERIGYTVLPTLALHLIDLDGLVVRPIEPTTSRILGTLVHPQKSLTPPSVLALEVVTEAVLNLGLRDVRNPAPDRNVARHSAG